MELLRKKTTISSDVDVDDGGKDDDDDDDNNNVLLWSFLEEILMGNLYLEKMSVLYYSLFSYLEPGSVNLSCC